MLLKYNQSQFFLNTTFNIYKFSPAILSFLQYNLCLNMLGSVIKICVSSKVVLEFS